jgi:hypothetical protein
MKEKLNQVKQFKMDDLERIVDSEYNNVTDLMGLDVDNVRDLLGKIQALTPIKQTKVVRALSKPKPVFAADGDNSRVEMEMKFGLLPKEIREGLLKKRLQLAESRLYVVKDISAVKSIDIYQGTDNKNVALANLANAKTEKDYWFILSAVRIQYATGVASQNDADFGVIPYFIRNGEFEMEVGNKKLFGLTDNDYFDTRNMTGVQTGYYKIKNTKLIEPQVEIKMPMKFSAAAPAQSWLKVTLIGTAVIPY